MNTFDTKLLKDPEIILRTKRRVGPVLWAAVPIILECLANVLEHAMPPATDPWAPKPEPVAKRTRKKRSTSRCT